VQRWPFRLPCASMVSILMLIHEAAMLGIYSLCRFWRDMGHFFRCDSGYLITSTRVLCSHRIQFLVVINTPLLSGYLKIPSDVFTLVSLSLFIAYPVLMYMIFTAFDITVCGHNILHRISHHAQHSSIVPKHLVGDELSQHA
jgi:hypothetical protein